MAIKKCPEVRIYKRKQESKKKKKVFLFFLVAFLAESVFSFFFFPDGYRFFLIALLVESVFSFILDRFLGLKRVFLFAYFLVFFYKFPPQMCAS